MNDKKKDDNNGMFLLGLAFWGFGVFVLVSESAIGSVFGFVTVVFMYLFVKPRMTRKNYKRLLLLLVAGAVALFFLGDGFFSSAFIKEHKSYFGGIKNLKLAFQNVPLAFNWPTEKILNTFVLPTLAVGYMFYSWTIILGFFLFKETAQERLWREHETKNAHLAKKPDFSKVNKTLFTNKYGVALGVDLWEKSGKQVIGVPYSWLNRHICLVGTTGSGKTTTLMRFLESGIANNKAVVFIDGKGDLGIVAKFEKLCTKYEKMPKVITLTGKELGYNPFKVGTPTELTDKIIGLFDWSEEHYKLGATRFIQLLIQYMQMQKIPMSLGNIVKYADTKVLTGFHIQSNQPEKPQAPAESVDADPLALLLSPDVPELDEVPEPIEQKPLQSESDILYEKIRGIEEKTKSGIRDRLATLAEGDMASLFTNTNALNLSEEIENCGCVLFSIDSLSYPLQSKGVGRLVVNDLKSTVPLHAKNGNKPVTVIFDEFNVFASHEVVDVINKSRSAGYEALLSFQSLSDIDKLDSGEALRRQIIQNCNTLIVQTQNDSKDAEELSALFGTFQSIETTVQEEANTGIAGAGSARMVHEYRVHPDDIKMLDVGEAFIKSPDTITKIKVAYDG